MDLSKVKELIGELIAMELNSKDINLNILNYYIRHVAIINFAGIILPCPCCITEKNKTHSLHIGCMEQCGNCKYGLKFKKLQSWIWMLDYHDQLDAVLFYSKQLLSLYSGLK